MPRTLATLFFSTLAGMLWSSVDVEASGWKADNIWWNIITNYNRSGQTICIAENLNNYAVTAYFDVFPSGTDLFGNPAHGTAYPTMTPHVRYRLFEVPDGTKPTFQCTLTSVAGVNSQGAGAASALAAQPSGIRSVNHVCTWDALDWDELYDPEKKAFETLGWSRDNWNSKNGAPSASKDWSELTRDERNAAQALGYNEQNWEVDCPNDTPD